MSSNFDLTLLTEKAEALLMPTFQRIEKIALANSRKVLSAFQAHHVSDACFGGTTGYGYDDKGREVLDKVYADVFHTESALVRLGFVNGTHAITAALFGILRPGDVLLSVTGAPYDTLQGVISGGSSSLDAFGVGYQQVELTETGEIDKDAVVEALKNPAVRLVFLSRSRGYSTRPSLIIEKIEALCKLVKNERPDVLIFSDNCYGEFVEEREPTDVGVDLIAGSLIKNPGGGVAPTGGYVAGRADLVEAAAERLTAPGIGGHCGPTLGHSRLLYQGLFLAPHTVAQAVKTAAFAARILSILGYAVDPKPEEYRTDIVQMISFGAPEKLLAFVRGIQQGAPVDSFVTPEPWEMPGYDCQVVMAAGAFVQGASIELSCDAPMREPYTAYLQGGLTYEMGKLGVLQAVEELLKNTNDPVVGRFIVER